MGKVVVYTMNRYSSVDWPPENALEFMAWMQGKLALIPAEFMDKAVVKIDSEGSSDERHWSKLTISYSAERFPDNQNARQK